MLAVGDLAITIEAPTGRLEILEPLSFTLEAGRTLGIVGESGSG